MNELLILVSELRINMQLGIPLSNSLEKFFQNNHIGYFKTLKIWVAKLQMGHEIEKLTQNYPELTDLPIKAAFLRVLEKGLRGNFIDPVLQDFEQELVMLIENDLERSIQMLPLKLLVPLTVFVLPSVILLLLIPIFMTLGGLQ